MAISKETLGWPDRVNKDHPAPPERAALAHRERLARNYRDVQIINRNAARLNREAMDTLGYQQLP
jgi:hypothetical protein